jgi:hypothetical protein
VRVEFAAGNTSLLILDPSCAGLTRASIEKRSSFAEAMDCRVKPGNDGHQ